MFIALLNMVFWGKFDGSSLAKSAAAVSTLQRVTCIFCYY